MWGGRASWLVLATMMSAAALAAAAATGVSWLPCGIGVGELAGGCRPAALAASALVVPTDPMSPISDVVTMAAMGLLGAAWAVFAATRGWPAGARVLTALPGTLTLVLAASSFFQLSAPASATDTGLSTVIVTAIDLTALVAGAVIVQATTGLDRIAHLIALWGAASFGWMRTIGDYMVTVALLGSGGVTQSGPGYVTAAAIVLSALLALAMGWRGGRAARAGSTGSVLPVPHVL